jgi:acyl carrier protein
VDDILARLQPIFRETLDKPGLVITHASNASNVDGWDSLAHINLVSVIESEFHIRFALGELQRLNNVGEMIELMTKKLAKKP